MDFYLSKGGQNAKNKKIAISSKLGTKNNWFYNIMCYYCSNNKDCEYINLLGERLQEKYGVKYLHADFKKQNGYLRSIQICKELGIYRQDYCGCEFSMLKEKSN